jgi:2'-5' RNA ligase
MNPNLKLIAIVPPEPVFTDIRKEQEYIAETWGPKHALRTPPHLTIVPPLSLTSGEMGWLFGMASALAATFYPFRLELKDYNSFKPRVVFIQPIVPKELYDLYELWHQALMVKMPHVLDRYPDRPYNPHVTLAHKDVTHPQFDKIWNYYSGKKYRKSFQVDHFCILSYHEHGWEVERKYYFTEEND